MEYIEILGPEGNYEDASVLDNAIKEQKQTNEQRKRKKRRNGNLQKDEGEAGELASNDMHRRGEDPVV